MSQNQSAQQKPSLKNTYHRRQLVNPFLSRLAIALLLILSWSQTPIPVIQTAQAGVQVQFNQAPPKPIPNVQALFFTAAGCGPCHQMQPTINHLIKKDFPIRPIDVNSSLDLARRLRITATPTVVILKNGMEVGRHSGILNAHGITSLLMQAGYEADQDVLTKPNLTTSVTNWMDKANAQKAMKRNHLQPTQSIPARDFRLPEKKAMQASVRIKVRYRSGNQMITDYGTGTVIHKHNKDILILTCGHIFRDSKGNAETILELGFENGKPTEIVRGQLLKYNAKAADIALIAASTQLPIKPVEIEKGNYHPQRADKVFSLGCDHGNPLTVRRGRYLNSTMVGPLTSQHVVTNTPTAAMALKYDITGRPATGRSGGGLFSSEGKLIGVCNAAMVNQDKGVYSAIRNVHQLLNETNLANLFRQPSSFPLGLENTQIASHSSPKIGTNRESIGDLNAPVASSKSGRFRPITGGSSFQIPSDGSYLARHLNLNSKALDNRIAESVQPSNQNINLHPTFDPASTARQTVVRGQNR